MLHFWEKKPDLSTDTRSLGESPSGSSFVLGNKTTGMPLSLAYSAPPQPAIQRKITCMNRYAFPKQRFMHYSATVPKLLIQFSSYHHKLAGRAHLPSISMSGKGSKSLSNACQVYGSISKRTFPTTCQGNSIATIVASLIFQYHGCFFRKKSTAH